MIKIISILIFLMIIVPTVRANESSPSASMSAELKVKLDNLKKDIASKAAKLKQEVNLRLVNKAFVGTLKSKTNLSLVLVSDLGDKNININQDTVFENFPKSKQKITLKTLSEKDYIAALGDVDDKGVLIAKKIVLQQTQKSSPAYLWGQIISISDKLITIQTRDLKKIAVSSASLKNLEIRDFIILTGKLGNNNIFKADFTYIIPQGGIIKPKKIATSSAQTATPSAKKY